MRWRIRLGIGNRQDAKVAKEKATDRMKLAE
jgi:hypothetical protein